MPRSSRLSRRFELERDSPALSETWVPQGWGEAREPTRSAQQVTSIATRVSTNREPSVI
ncbi:hypothetical protein [Methylococcus mesophilus]|uniref:hypothetical protein n=1 Tax=Methylococcus mesophilus TaxID=2993564 RepID=UPI00224B4849|nr:hypothetical protein [Methylococcus mesophilus]UZR30616.1 hypothetical protein OOT43_08275 [Methylococcus mesophilus]